MATESNCCDGPYSDDFVRLIKSAKVVGEPMTIEEFTEWMRQVCSSPPASFR